MKKTILTALLAAALSTSTLSAYDFSSGGIYYNKLSENTCAVSYFYRGGYSGAINVPETVEYDEVYTVVAVGNEAFSNCSGVTSVTLPATITSIGDKAFYYCTGMSKINIPTDVEAIGSEAFYGCRSVNEFNLPVGLKSLGSGAFNSCTSIKSITIPDGVTSIGESTFYGCTALESVLMSDNITNIGRYAFNYCSKITDFKFPSALESVGQYAFNSCRQLEVITIPASVTTIDSYAFFNCAGATELKFEDSENAITIGADAFSGVGCNNVYIGRDIESAILTGNGSIKTLELGGNCTSIPADAFKGCTALEHLILGANISTIGAAAFEECTAITNIDSENNVPPTVESDFAQEVYTNCELSVPAGTKSAYEAASVWKNFTKITDPTQTGLSEITISEEAVYYNLQGVRVNNPLSPGVYIRRAGNKATKVLVK